MSDVTIYHNPSCGNSRGALALIREAGIEPDIIEYLKTPPDRATLTHLIDRMGVPVIDVVRTKEPLFAELGLDKAGTDDQTLIDAMLAHPKLINRPIVVTDQGVKLCRPPETVLDILPKK